MEINLVQITSACIVLVSTLIPLNFMIGVKARRQRVLSSILLIVLAAYSTHSLLEVFALLGADYQVFTKLCFVISAFGLIASYSFYQMKGNHTLIGGIYGISMIAAFGTWITVELFEAASVISGESIEMAENISSIVMAVFALFLIGRYFWLRSILPIEPNYLRS